MGDREDLAEWAKSLAFVDPTPSNAAKMWRALADGCRLGAGRVRVRLVVYVAAGGKVSSAPFSNAQTRLFENFLKKSLPSDLTLDKWDRLAGSVELRKSGIEAWHVVLDVM